MYNGADDLELDCLAQPLPDVGVIVFLTIYHYAIRFSNRNPRVLESSLGSRRTVP